MAVLTSLVCFLRGFCGLIVFAVWDYTISVSFLVGVTGGREGGECVTQCNIRLMLSRSPSVTASRATVSLRLMFAARDNVSTNHTWCTDWMFHLLAWQYSYGMHFKALKHLVSFTTARPLRYLRREVSLSPAPQELSRSESLSVAKQQIRN